MYSPAYFYSDLSSWLRFYLDASTFTMCFYLFAITHVHVVMQQGDENGSRCGLPLAVGMLMDRTLDEPQILLNVVPFLPTALTYLHAHQAPLFYVKLL